MTTTQAATKQIVDTEMDALDELERSMREPHQMTSVVYSMRDGKPNLRMARALLCYRGMQLTFHDRTDGADAWLVRETVLEETELKSSIVRVFMIYTSRERETPELLERLIQTSWLFGVFSRAGKLEEIWYIAPGGPLSAQFQKRLDMIRAGAPQKRKQLSLKQVKELGGTRLI
jgi:hypothetical protein